MEVYEVERPGTSARLRSLGGRSAIHDAALAAEARQQRRPRPCRACAQRVHLAPVECVRSVRDQIVRMAQLSAERHDTVTAHPEEAEVLHEYVRL